MLRWLSKQAERENDESDPIRPQRVARLVGELAGEGTIFTCDTGTVTVWGARHLRLLGDARFTLSAGLGTMGYGVPAAIGAQLAYPGRRVVALVGDGSMQMLLGEFLTAVAKKLPITVVVFSNHKLGLIQMEQESSGYPESETQLPELDFGAFAELAGGKGLRVKHAHELEAALRTAFESAVPCVVDVHVNPEELTIPPRVEMHQALGFLRAKAKEFLGKGDKEGGLSAIRETFA
jgi:thiamine pyrophosphate-dependent acetolactate synthase large subunit-like protein